MGKFTQSPNGNNLGSESCNDLILDEKFETSYCVGMTNGSFGKISDGSLDAFIAKFDRKGDILWVRQFASPNGGEDVCSSAGIDQHGNVFCGGYTRGLMENNPERYDTSNPREAVDNDIDAFVMKINSSGSILWVKQFGTTKDEYCSNIAVSPVGNAYCGSRTNGVLGEEAVGGLEVHNEVPNVDGVDTNFDAYIAKLSPFGQVLWRRQIGFNGYGEAADVFDTCGGVTIDREENVTCGGNTLGSLVEVNGGSEDLIIWSFTKDGNQRFLKQIGEETKNASNIIDNTSFSDQAFDITTDPKGNIYLAGLTLSDFTRTNPDRGQDPYILKFDRDGVLLIGAQEHFSGHQSIQTLWVDQDEKVYMLGQTTSFAYEALGGGADIFIVKLKPDLHYEWAKQFGQSSGLDSNAIESAVGMALDKAGNIYIGGFTKGNFGESNADSTNQSNDIFMLRMTNDGFFK